MSDEIKEIDSVKSLEEYNQSNEVIIECSKKCDPYLAIVAAADTIGKGREIRSVVEKILALWLDDNKELYKVIKEQKQKHLVEKTLSNIYEQDVNIINKTLKSLCDEIKKYNNKEYFIEMNNKKITHCVKDNPAYETLSNLAEMKSVPNFE